MLATLERDDRFRSFTLDGQAVVLEDYLELRPEQEARLRALLAAGRLVVGPSYVLPDEFLVGGESLVRNLFLGRAVCRRLGAEPSRAGYLPDSFGHPAQLPQVLSGFGIDSFLFSRGLGDELERVGRVFRWRAPDGSEVTAFNLLGHYDSAAKLRSREDLAERAQRLVERHEDELARVGVHDVLLLNGSDHLPVQPELPDLLPDERFRISSLDEYVASVRPHLRGLPVYEGELLGSREQNVLRGVNSARMYLKQANERAERHLLSVETAAAVAALGGHALFPTADFRFAWRELLRNQPHDSICGCSVDEVHEDMLERYARLERTISVLEREALGPLPLDSAHAQELYRPAPRTEANVFNPLPWRRRRLVCDTLVELEGFETKTVALGQSATRTLENEHYRVEASRDGTVTVTDRRGKRYEGLHRFEDEPDVGDLYNFCPSTGAMPRRSEGASARERDGILELEYPDFDARTVVRLFDERIEFETEIDNRTSDHRLRVSFPAPNAGKTVRAEGQFAVLARPVVPPAPRVEWVEPPDATQHTLGAVALGDLALFTKGLPEYEARDGELVLTLLRCVGVISRGAGEIATRPLRAGPAIATPGGQCIGRHRFSYALRFGRLDEVELLRAAHDYRFDFLVGLAGPPPPAPLRLTGDPVAFSCLKGAEDGDGVILRLYNPSRAAARVGIETQAAVARVRLDETDERALEGRAITLAAGEIATLRLRRTVAA